jgi:UDP-glucose 4-epimerase
VVGPRQTGAYGMVLPRLVDAALAGRPLVVHDDGRQQRSFAHVSDVVRMVLGLMACPAATGGVCNIGSDQPVSILELAQRVIAAVEEGREERGEGREAALGTEVPSPRDCPSPLSPLLSRFSSLPSSLAPRPSSLQIEFQSYTEAYGADFEDCRRRVPDLSKLRTLTEIQARYSLDDIIRELVAWKRSRLGVL